MPCLERYFRNRLKLQIFSNYLGVAGALFFSLQNLSTNWGGNYSDDSSLTDAVKVLDPPAGVALQCCNVVAACTGQRLCRRRMG